jgi:hypothetical protein
VTNSGTIQGGSTAGVVFSDLTGVFNNTLVNSGEIAGVSGSAVLFGAGSDLLEVLPGADFSGLVDGGTGVNTLELAAGTGAGSLFGLGTNVNNFGLLQFDSGAQWTLGGNTIGLGGVITGFNANDMIDLSGFAAASESFANNALVLTDANTAQVTLQLQGSFSSDNFHLASDGSGGTDITVCYVAGTHILTATGERLVENLVRGDIIITLSGDESATRPVKWIGRRRIDLMAHPHPEMVAPVRIQRSAFADDVPHRDLLVSPEHAVFIDGKLICARQLVNGTTIRQEQVGTSVEYFHIELDAHAILLAEGLPAESYLNTGNRGFFANSGDPLMLHPDLTDETDYPTREAGSCAPFVFDEAGVWPVWQRLVNREEALGYFWTAPATTEEAGLHLLANGQSIWPVAVDGGQYVFALPAAQAGCGSMRLVSRSASPSDLVPYPADRRRLGVAVTRIVVRSGEEPSEIPVDHLALSRGWHEAERDGGAPWRWTNGDAILPLPTFSGPVLLEVHLGGTMTYIITAEPETEAQPKVA